MLARDGDRCKWLWPVRRCCIDQSVLRLLIDVYMPSRWKSGCEAGDMTWWEMTGKTGRRLGKTCRSNTLMRTSGPDRLRSVTVSIHYTRKSRGELLGYQWGHTRYLWLGDGPIIERLKWWTDHGLTATRTCPFRGDIIYIFFPLFRVFPFLQDRAATCKTVRSGRFLKWLTAFTKIASCFLLFSQHRNNTIQQFK
jgi:hypothetical protein